jgi:DNA-binding FrmR family transcriptional regulator
MDDVTKRKILARLKRAEGQVSAVRRMVDQDDYCVDILTQISAAQGALGRVSQILLGGHIEHCVSDALASGDEARRQETIEELMQVFGRYGTLREN